MPAWRRLLSLALPFVLFVACSDEDGPEPVGIMWGSGASGAFVGDTMSLAAFYRDAAGDPIGQPRPPVSWVSSRPSVLAIVEESLAVALDTGTAVLTATTTNGPSYQTPVSFEIIPPWQGRLVWARQLTAGAQVRLVASDLPNRTVQQLPDFGYPGQGHGRPRLTSDGSRIVAQARRPTAPGSNTTIFILDFADSGIAAPLESMPGNQFAPVWMPGDTLVAFLTEAPTGYEIFTARLDGTDVQQRTQLRQAVPPFFDVTAEQHVVLPLRLPGNAVDLFEMTLQGDTVRRLTYTPSVEEGFPSVSPDGSKIAFSTALDVWIVDRDGANPRPLLMPRRVPVTATHTTQTVTRSPMWAGDSRFLLIDWSIDPAWTGSVYTSLLEIYAVRVSDGMAVRVTKSSLIDAQAVFR